MKVFKFGGASIKDAQAIKKVSTLLKRFAGEELVVVVSAMGKMTNALERVVNQFFAGKNFNSETEIIRTYHNDQLRGLFPTNHSIWKKIENEINSINTELKTGIAQDQVYDQVVSKGEILSSLIVAEFLNLENTRTRWADARDYISTDSTFREGKVDWKRTEALMTSLRTQATEGLVVTQGFIGRTPEGLTTTLGREGSDFSAAIFASCLKAESVTIWKDVPGVMNADPKRIKNAVVFEELPFSEAAEMTYYGASVIHPKTIKPLANRKIPLYVKNFDDPSLPGTVIHETKISSLPPLIVFKDNQCLVSCRATDYTFIDEQQLGFIFNVLSELNIKINVMQNSAISFSFCIDFREDKVLKLIARLGEHFEVYYNTDLTLITIKNYDTNSYEEYRRKPGILLEQSSRSTLQILIKN